MTAPRLILLATLGSAALLLGAFGFQVLGYAPCKMCLWQRWPHAAAVLIGTVILLGGPRVLAWLGAAAAATTGGIGIYHAGVEWRWWEGPTTCSGGGAGLTGLSGADLLSTETPTNVVMCDEIVWQFLGLSMAGWNAAISFVLVLLWITAARRT
ncbi:disulfide bond formation protein B [Sulfitobacter aestuariivivens]|uniref:Disulfide bond formation protein B n=1 Tax=Sulfitobacter aestuariivivens TaxID=2766981 RepID=A0A927D4H8_9RHOB|nr:disulfide bond formation protein B [Sulfitobacter aestuariivivens]MBD3663087.1 disulfide bond formation protein B [Sulfitobacter aestuariivivens]